MLGEARRGPLIPLGEKLGIRVQETRGNIRKVLYGCEIPAVLSEKLCVCVRDPRCKRKSSVAKKKTHDHVYHLDLELSDRSRD